MEDVMFRSDVLFCMFDPTSEIHRVGLPNKVFEAMSIGRPIMVTKGLYYSKCFVEKENCGVSIPYTLEDVIKCLMYLAVDNSLCVTLGENGLNAAINKYNWNQEKNQLIKVYGDLL